MCEKSYISAAAPIDTMTLHNQVCQHDASSEALSHHKMESHQNLGLLENIKCEIRTSLAVSG